MQRSQPNQGIELAPLLVRALPFYYFGEERERELGVAFETMKGGCFGKIGHGAFGVKIGSGRFNSFQEGGHVCGMI